MQDYNDEFNKNFSNEQTTRLNNPSIVEELIVMKTRDKLYMPLNFQDSGNFKEKQNTHNKIHITKLA